MSWHDIFKHDIEKHCVGKIERGPYQPKTGEVCHCKPGRARDNCPACEGTGMKIDFARIRKQNRPG